VKWRKSVRLLLFAVIASSLVLCVNRPANAAGSWDAALDGIDVVYDGLTVVQTLVKQESAEISALRKKNNDALSALNAKIKAIDQTAVTRLTQESESLQRKHASLLEQYASLGKQVTAAKKRKDKKSADLLELKRNQLKPSALAAAAEIKAKKEALAAAKKTKAAKAKVVKDALIPVQTLKKQITAENKSVAAARKHLSAADKRYKASVKRGDAIVAALELKTVYDQTQAIHASLTKVYDWEKKIAQALSLASTKLP
jgi:predicted  nucleic acid-binding Zn-ribbon protein